MCCHFCFFTVVAPIMNSCSFIVISGVCLLWHLHTFSKQFAFPYHENPWPYVENLCGLFEFPQFMRVYLLFDLLCKMYCSFDHVFFLMVSNSLLSLVASMNPFYALCSSTLLAQTNTCWLVISLVFLNAGNSSITSVIISSLLMPLKIALSVFHLFLLHSVALILRWPIHYLAYNFALLCVVTISHENIHYLFLKNL